MFLGLRGGDFPENDTRRCCWAHGTVFSVARLQPLSRKQPLSGKSGRTPYPAVAGPIQQLDAVAETIDEQKQMTRQRVLATAAPIPSRVQASRHLRTSTPENVNRLVQPHPRRDAFRRTGTHKGQVSVC